ncbi:UNVERIFIED_CONTAM: hypothetical protein FKN15_063956 [Acipenser sinensis]
MTTRLLHWGSHWYQLVVLKEGIDYKTTTILLDGRRVKLQLWDTSGQGRFCTIFRSYSRGAQGVILVYDITNRWSFDGIDRWIKEIDEVGYNSPAVLSLQDLCCRSIVSCTPVHLVDKLPLPVALKSHLKSFSMANGLNARMMHGRSYSLTASSGNKRNSLKKNKMIGPPQSPSQSCARNSCKIS